MSDFETPEQRAQTLVGEGNAHLRSGRRDAARAAYRQALAIKPDFADAEVALGVIHEDLGQCEDAVACYRRALQINPDFGVPGQPRASAACWIWSRLGTALQSLGRHEEAVGAFRQALQLMPNLPEAHGNLGNALHALGRLEEAAASYRRALAISPNYAEVFCNLGNVLNDLGQLPEAVECYQRAVEIRPDVAIFHFNLGNAQHATGALAEAVQSYREASQRDPGRAETQLNLGRALHALGQYDAALASFRKAIELKRDYAFAHNNISQTLKEQGRFDEAVVECRRALEIDPDHAAARSNLLLIHNYISGHRPEDLLAEARVFGERVAQKAHPATSWRNDPDPARRLRVGFVSGDLRNHPVGHFTESTFAALRRAFADRLELYVYANQAASDAVTHRIKAHCHGWRTVSTLTDAALARQIGEDRIDILIDLSGHTAENRLPMFAWKPAPIQATWLGYSATTGVAAIDYYLADPWTLPVAEEGNFTEKIWRLPETLVCFTPPAEAVAVVPRTASSDRGITFGCFNNLTKVNAAVVAVWARLLDTVPRSTLFLKARQLQDPQERARIVAQFARKGIAAGRLRLEAHSSRAGYLAAYNDVDIALDTFPFAGGMTTVEALWMGVPVLTLAGRSLFSRQGVGSLANVGLSDWIAGDVDDYVTRAAAHAADLPRLAALHARLRQQLLASPLCDAPRFAVHFEAALRGMWKIWCDQQSPPR